jgi:H3 lysine-79-specific histone-lysine N-methyltransferase
MQETRLGPDSVFVDLGSGVGNCLIQASLATGCTSYGFESMPGASGLAARQLDEARSRARMWGIHMGSVQARQADFLSSADVDQVLKRADVILVNNYAFTPTTNDALGWKFLDLKESATVVSLKPFVPSDFRLTERTVNSPAAILNQTSPKRYPAGSVSWTAEGGAYYIAVVDRDRVETYARSLEVNRAA